MRGSTVAEVAGTDMPAREVSNEFDTRLRQMQQQYGANLDRRAAVSLGLMNQALEAAVARRLVDAHARRPGPDHRRRDGGGADPAEPERSRAQAGSSASGSTCSCAASA